MQPFSYEAYVEGTPLPYEVDSFELQFSLLSGDINQIFFPVNTDETYILNLDGDNSNENMLIYSNNDNFEVLFNLQFGILDVFEIFQDSKSKGIFKVLIDLTVLKYVYEPYYSEDLTYSTLPY